MKKQAKELRVGDSIKLMQRQHYWRRVDNIYTYLKTKNVKPARRGCICIEYRDTSGNLCSYIFHPLRLLYVVEAQPASHGTMVNTETARRRLGSTRYE